MARAIRFRQVSTQKFIAGTLFWHEHAPFLFAGDPDHEPDWDEDVAEVRERKAIESHCHDYAEALGVADSDVEAVIIDWDGRIASLPPQDADDYITLPAPRTPTQEEIDADNAKAEAIRMAG